MRRIASLIIAFVLVSFFAVVSAEKADTLTLLSDIGLTFDQLVAKNGENYSEKTDTCVTYDSRIVFESKCTVLYYYVDGICNSIIVAFYEDQIDNQFIQYQKIAEMASHVLGNNFSEVNTGEINETNYKDLASVDGNCIGRVWDNLSNKIKQTIVILSRNASYQSGIAVSMGITNNGIYDIPEDEPSAEIDISALSYDELIALRDKIDLAIWNSKEWQEVVVPQGVYEVGVDIPEGHWTIYAAPKASTYVRWGKKINEEKTSLSDILTQTFVTSRRRNDFDIYNDIESISCDLKSGQYLSFECGSVIFTPYAGKTSLRFRQSGLN